MLNKVGNCHDLVITKNCNVLSKGPSSESEPCPGLTFQAKPLIKE